MRVSIIVPASNEEQCIAETRYALHQLEGEKEVIMVDAGSADGTAALAVAQGATAVIAPKGRGTQTHAENMNATRDVLWFVQTPAPLWFVRVYLVPDNLDSIEHIREGWVFRGRVRCSDNRANGENH